MKYTLLLLILFVLASCGGGGGGGEGDEAVTTLPPTPVVNPLPSHVVQPPPEPSTTPVDVVGPIEVPTALPRPPVALPVALPTPLPPAQGPLSAEKVFFRELHAVLLAMPDKRLIYGSLADTEGACTLGVMLRARGFDLHEVMVGAREITELLGVNQEWVDKIVRENDAFPEAETGFERWQRMVAWVESQAV